MSNAVIERNGVNKTLGNYEIVKGDKKGTKYQAPTITIENYETDVVWFGVSNIVNCVQTWAKRTFQQLHFDNVREDGTFDEAKWLAEAADFTSAGMKLKDINEKIDELSTLQAQLVQTFDPSDTAQVANIRELGQQILVYKAMAEAKSRKKTTEVEEAAAVPVA